MKMQLDTSVLTPDFIARSIGQFIKRTRKKAKVQQTALGELIGLDQSAVSRMEAGKQQLTAVQWFIFCTHFKVSPGHMRVAIRQSLRKLTKRKALKDSPSSPKTSSELRVSPRA